MNGLAALKIPALRGKGAETNILILELLALEGSQTVWRINKLLGRSRHLYPTVQRAVSRLKKSGYVTKTGTVKMAKRNERIATYGLTLRGFVASLTSGKACSNVLNVLEKNPQIEFPFPKDEVLPMIREWFSDEQIEKRVRSLLEAFIKAIPDDIESIDEKELFAYLFPTLAKDPTMFEELQRIILSMLHESHKYPKTLNWLNPRLDNYTKTLEEALETAKKLREMLQRR